VARIAPQKSTQYADLASTLALPEWQISPLGRILSHADPLTLGAGNYLQLALDRSPTAADRQHMGLLAMTSEFYEFYPHIGDLEGPFLRPLETPAPAVLPQDLVFTRRYRGKTNELFTRFLLNVAYFSSHFVATGTLPRLTVLDPLCGGGTALFQALVYGWDAFGVERNDQDVASTDTFLRQYLREQKIPFRRRKERLREIGRRYSFEIERGGGRPRRCTLAQADTADTPRVLEGKKVHLVVADLPYGVQHSGMLRDLLAGGLEAWVAALRPGGTLTLAWETRRLSREQMVRLLEAGGELTVLRDGPYETLAHRVDRVIKERDVVVARKPRG
jgi:SAM-dependent methyltransferase